MGDPEEYIGAVTLMSMLGIEYGSGVHVLVMIHTLVENTRMRSMMIQNFQFDSQDYYWTIEMFGSGWYEFFQLRYDARGRRGFTTLQKCVAAIRLMAMGESPDTMNDYMRMSERTARESLYTLSRGVVETFGDVYLRKPSLHDLQELYVAHEERHGFPGMIGSIDCTHWKWKNCSRLLLLKIYGFDMHFFGVAGFNNDVNVLDQSPIFDDLLNGKAPDAPFAVNGNEYKYRYYLTDGIYPQYFTFVKAFRHPVEERDKNFKRRQEGARKDVEGVFGVLKAKWHIVEHAARPLDLETL
ncbi:hypothetical protein Lser_V15G16987 [Lactuca serriola]